MLKRELRPIIGFILLIIAVYVFQNDHGSIYGLILSSVLVIAFWYLNGLTFAVSSLRNMVVMSAFFGVIVLGAQFLFPSPDDNAKMGQLEGSDLNPAQIARLKESHEIAMELYLDHHPSLEERYFKVGQLPWTSDGFHYMKSKTQLDIGFLPKAKAWADHLSKAATVDDDIHAIETWMRADFAYTLTPGSLQTGHPLDEFLFESRKGFCEHYAASVATLLKLRGHQTQVVVGYSGGSWNALVHRLTYLESDAHAWVEVADPSTHQWRIVDPTDWVLPVAPQSSWTEWNPMVLSLALLAALVIGAIVYVFVGPSDAHEALVKKIERLEQKNQLDSVGLTISERITRLASVYPKRAARMQVSLAAYLSTYFEADPTNASERKLIRTLQKW